MEANECLNKSHKYLLNYTKKVWKKGKGSQIIPAMYWPDPTRSLHCRTLVSWLSVSISSRHRLYHCVAPLRALLNDPATPVDGTGSAGSSTAKSDKQLQQQQQNRSPTSFSRTRCRPLWIRFLQQPGPRQNRPLCANGQLNGVHGWWRQPRPLPLFQRSYAERLKRTHYFSYCLIHKKAIQYCEDHADRRMRYKMFFQLIWIYYNASYKIRDYLSCLPMLNFMKTLCM